MHTEDSEKSLDNDSIEFLNLSPQVFRAALNKMQASCSLKPEQATKEEKEVKPVSKDGDFVLPDDVVLEVLKPAQFIALSNFDSTELDPKRCEQVLQYFSRAQLAQLSLRQLRQLASGFPKFVHFKNLGLLTDALLENKDEFDIVFIFLAECEVYTNYQDELPKIFTALNKPQFQRLVVPLFEVLLAHNEILQKRINQNHRPDYFLLYYQACPTELKPKLLDKLFELNYLYSYCQRASSFGNTVDLILAAFSAEQLKHSLTRAMRDFDEDYKMRGFLRYFCESAELHERLTTDARKVCYEFLKEEQTTMISWREFSGTAKVIEKALAKLAPPIASEVVSEQKSSSLII